MSQEKFEASFARIRKPVILHDDLLEHVAYCHEIRRPFEAYRAWRLWCQQHPADPFGWMNAAVVAANGGFRDEAVICSIELLNMRPDDDVLLFALSMILNSSTFAGNLDQEKITFISESYTRHLQKDKRLLQIPDFCEPPFTGSAKKRRIGYYWDFFDWGSEFSFPFHHDRERFEVVAVTPATEQCNVEKLGVDSVIKYPTDDLFGAVRTIRAGGLDLLIDLNGRGSNRYSDLILEARVAPLQAIFGNFYASCFSRSIDALIGDQAILEVISAHNHSEQLIPLAEACMPVRNPHHTNAPQQIIIPPRNYKYRIGTTGNHLKIGPVFIKFLSAIMRSIPDSSFFYTSLPFPEKEGYLKTYFQNEGISLDRVELLTESGLDYCSMVNEIDVAIDPTPYNGHLSTYEFLAQGTPVWSVRGPRMTERYGQMLIGHVGMTEWVFDSQEDLIASLAKNIQVKTPEASARLRRRVSDSALGDPARATRLMEDAIETLINQTR